ncbi:hypothetical protein B0H66DRAFT_467124 [Apodospora peruviana]|uniref:Uncharacterized protein n=1 Tax=Apodospora peruviana TaxID=516989 RepID=A0AAE0MEX5_9PEZI|nr:hypothetical protein B0H66DRAFT_467124 [Apodospora peruviana]
MDNQNARIRGVGNAASSDDTMPPPPIQPAPGSPSSSQTPVETNARMDTTPSRSARFSARDDVTPPQPAQRSARGQQDPSTQTPRRTDWTVDKIADKLSSYVSKVESDHATLVEFMLEEAEKKAPERRHLDTTDAFAGLTSKAIDGPPEDGLTTMSLKMKQHSGEYGKSKGAGRRVLFPVVKIKSNKEAVPRYRFHHVEIKKNILTPNTMLSFVPHLRDVDPNSAEEKKYSNWLIELEKLDSQSGFKTKDRATKAARRDRDEYAVTLSVYLQDWLEELNIEGCTKSNLIKYMANQPRPLDTITPQQASTLRDKYGEDQPETLTGAQIFTEAFNRVFAAANVKNKRPVTLSDVLMLDKSVETVVDNKRAKENPTPQKHRDPDLVPRIEKALASYSILGCMICFSHDCEHGEFDAENQRGTFCIEMSGGFALTLKEKWAAQLAAQRRDTELGIVRRTPPRACHNHCWVNHDVGNSAHDVEPWSESEVGVLERIFATLGHSQNLKPSCIVAPLLGRECWEVHQKMTELNLTLPEVELPPPMPKIKALPWYDRKKKELKGDWQDCTVTHEHASREMTEPCHHSGPCTAHNGCPCANVYPHPILCERFCHCTAEDCALKFTGCGCSKQGKTCVQNKKEGKPCICVLLNRECDPVLCGSCGSRERADPANAHDEDLHSHGCQNVSLQRGAAKVLLLGKSQLLNCGYGLFTAESIAQDEFIIEYTGELITHDEGVRREARRGDVFDESTNSSYLFTLLEHEGIWVDAAIYGNLSRYINHATEPMNNITPKIVYVNGEFRIKFTALRDIKAGDELFFNYGDNFPNLTKKLLEQDDGKDGTGTAPQKRKSSGQQGTARKSTSKKGKGADLASGAVRGKGGKGRNRPAMESEDDMMRYADIMQIDDDGEDFGDEWEDRTPRRRKKRGGRRPGAGRKKKQPVDAAHVGGGAAGQSGGSHHLAAEISDSQGESPVQDTPMTRRARLIGISPTSGSGQSDQSQGITPIKKPSKRGGARPGAGRKPKHPKPTAAARRDAKDTSGEGDTSNTRESNNDQSNRTTAPEDSEDLPLIMGQQQQQNQRGLGSAALTTTNTSAGGSGSRKRKATSDPGDDGNRENELVVLLNARAGASGGNNNNSSSLGNLPFRQDQFQPMSDVAMDEDDDDDGDEEDGEDDDSVVDRSARKRQKPLRYRLDETS